MKKKHLNLIFVTVLVFSLLSCSSEKNPINNNGNNDSIIYLFPVKENLRWKMENSNKDTAYFQAGAIDTFSFAKVFWDTAIENRINLPAIPIEFVHWEGKLKKRKYFALGLTDNGYFFAIKTNPMIEPTESYPLDFYSIYFFIPNNPNVNGFTEIISEKLNYGIIYYLVKTEAEWKNTGMIYWKGIMQRNWEVIYESKREDINPKTYIKEFQFLENIGFYKYNDYELVDIYEVEY